MPGLILGSGWSLWTLLWTSYPRNMSLLVSTCFKSWCWTSEVRTQNSIYKQVGEGIQQVYHNSAVIKPITTRVSDVREISPSELYIDKHVYLELQIETLVHQSTVLQQFGHCSEETFWTPVHCGRGAANERPNVQWVVSWIDLRSLWLLFLGSPRL